MADKVRRIVAEFSAKNKAKGETAAFRRDMDSTGESMKRMAGQALAMAGVGGGLYGLKRGFDYVAKAAMKQEDAVFQLSAALKVIDEYSEITIGRFKRFAASIQQATIYGDEEVLALMRMGSTLGISTDKLEEATKAAISLGAAFGGRMRPQMAMRYYAQALEGVTSSLETYVVAMRGVNTYQEKMKILQEALIRGWAIAEAQAETTSGSIQRMKMAYSDTAEVIGDTFLPSIKKLSEEQKRLCEENRWALKRYLSDIREGVEMTDSVIKPIMKKWWSYTLPAYIWRKVYEPEERAKPVPARPEYPMPEMTQRILAMGRGEIERRLQQKEEMIVQMAAMDVRRMELEEAFGKKMLIGEEKRVKDAAAAMEKLAQDERELLAARADAYRDMYGQMGRMTEDVYRVQSEALGTLRKDYMEAGVAAETLNVWFKEQAEILQIEYMQAAGGIARGFEAAGMQIKREVKTWGEIAYEFSMEFESSIARGLENTLRDFKNWKELLLNMFEEIYWSAVRIAFIQPLAKELAGGMTAGIGALFGGGGAGAGMTAQQQAATPGWTYRFQEGGIARRPQIAMIGEVPEAVVPLSGGRSIPVEMRGGSERITNIHIHNKGSENLEISSAVEYFLGEQRIIDIVTQAAQTNMPYIRSIAQAAKR